MTGGRDKGSVEERISTTLKKKKYLMVQLGRERTSSITSNS